MSALNKIPNHYNYQNIGGKIAQTLKYETNRVPIAIDKPLFDIDNHDTIEITPIIDKRFILSFAKDKKKRNKKIKRLNRHKCFKVIFLVEKFL